VPGLFSDVLNRLRDLPLVKPPENGVDFNLGAVVPVTVEIRSTDGPVAGASVAFRGKSCSGSWSVGDSGRFQTLLAPRATYTLDARAEGFVRKSVKIETGEAGQAQTEVVLLDPRAEPGAVRVTVVPPRSPGPSRLPFRLEPVGDAGENVRRTVAAVDGAFLIKNVVPGRYRLTAAHGLSGASTYCCEKTAEVEVVSGCTAKLTIRLELGGRLRVAVRDDEGRFVSRRCRVVDERGSAVKLWFRRLGRTGEWMASINWTHDSGSAETFPSIAPGTYRVEFPNQAGAVEKAVTVRVKPGKTVDVVWTVK